MDVQWDFIHGPLAVHDAESIFKPLIATAQEADHVIFTADSHPRDHCSFTPNGGRWPVHCVADTLGATIDYRLREAFPDAPVILKGESADREEYSAGDKLVRAIDGTAGRNAIVAVTGLAYDFCVKQTALDLNEHFEVGVAIDCTRPVTFEGGVHATLKLDAANVFLWTTEPDARAA